jgi:ElaB/YqjD/DUF883 family membrane-anchored ribosome-binding protein
MDLPLKERITRTRDSLRQSLGETTDQLKLRGEELRLRGEELRQRAEERVEQNRGRLALAEAAVLEGAANALARARETLGERAAFTERGEKALREALVELRAGHTATLPIADYDTLSVKQALPLFATLNLAELRTVRAFEARNKDRITVLRELDRRLGQLEAS